MDSLAATGSLAAIRSKADTRGGPRGLPLLRAVCEITASSLPAVRAFTAAHRIENLVEVTSRLRMRIFVSGEAEWKCYVPPSPAIWPNTTPIGSSFVLTTILLLRCPLD